MSHYTVTQILTNKIIITTFLLVPVKYGINLRMAQGTQCLHAISNYMKKVELKYQHVIGHNYTTIQQFKESRDKKTM